MFDPSSQDLGLQTLEELKAESKRRNLRDPIQLGFLDPDDRIGLERSADFFTQKLTDRSAKSVSQAETVLQLTKPA